MSGTGGSPGDRRRSRRDQARRQTYRRRRLVLVAVVSAFVLVCIGAIVGSGGGDSEGEAAKGPTAEEIRAEKARKLAIKREREDRAIQRTLNYTSFMRGGAGKKRQVALTFDDGPGPSTEKILNILRRTGTPATFFVVGTMVPDGEKALKRIVREGHALGNHTQNHPAMGSLDFQTQSGEITGQEEAVEAAGVKQQRLFRPPYRSYNRSTFDLLEERGDLMILWNVDTNDYANPDPAGMVSQVLNEVEPGSIVLMHDGPSERESTVRALPDIIKGLKARKLKPVTIPEMVRNDPPARGEQYPEGV